MELKEMFDRIVLQSGQYLLKRKNIEIDIDNFRFLVESALSIYSESIPYSKTYEIDMGGRSYTFTSDFDESMGRIPDWISEVNPIRYINSNPFRSNSFFAEHPTYGNPELIEPSQYIWDYNEETGQLVVEIEARISVRAVYDHIVEDTGRFTDTGDVIYEVKTINVKDYLFLDLLRGMFLEGLGRHRRAFTHNDMPILMDADQMISDAKDLIESSTEKIGQKASFDLAMG